MVGEAAGHDGIALVASVFSSLCSTALVRHWTPSQRLVPPHLTDT